MDVGSIGDDFIDELLADDGLSRMIESVEVPGLGSSGDMDVDQILYMDTPSTADYPPFDSLKVSFLFLF